jgi:hypothetical protein
MDATVEAATTHVSPPVGDVRSGSPARTTHAERMEAGVVGWTLLSCTTHAEGITPVVDANDAAAVSVALLSSPGHSVEQVVGATRASSAPTAMEMESAAETDMVLSEVTLAT